MQVIENRGISYNVALFENMSFLAESVRAIDARTGELTIFVDRRNPELNGRIFSYDEALALMKRDIHPDDVDYVLEKMDLNTIRTLKESKVHDARAYVDGKQTHITRYIVTPELNEQGETVRVYISFQDIQSDIDAKKEKEDMEKYLSAVSCGILQYTRDSKKILFANDIALNILGYESIQEMQDDGFDGVVKTVDPNDAIRMKEMIDNLSDADDTLECEYTVNRKDGSTVICYGNIKMLYLDGGEPIIQRSMFDITESRRTSEQFRETIGTLSGAKMGMWSIILNDGPAQLISDNTMAELVGITTDMSPVMAYSIFESNVDKKHLDDVKKCIEEIASGKPAEVTYPYNHPVKGRMMIRCGGTRDENYRGEGILLRGYHQDITIEALKDKKRQREKAEAFDIIDALSRDFSNIFIVDPRKRSVKPQKLSGFIEEMIQSRSVYPYDMLSNKYIDLRVFPEDKEIFRKAINLDHVLSVLMENDTYSEAYRILEGDELHYQECKFVNTNDGKIILGFRNVDDTVRESMHQQELLRKANEKAHLRARQAQQNLDMINDIIGSGFWYMVFDKNGEMTRVSWSQKFREMLGYTDENDFPENLNSWINTLHPDDKVATIASFWDGIKGTGVFNRTFRCKSKNGEYSLFQTVGRCARYDNGNPRIFLGTFINVTMAENEKRDINGRLDAVLGGVNGGLIICRMEPSYPYEYISESVAEIQGYSPEELHEMTAGNSCANIYKADLNEAEASIAGQLCEFNAYTIKYRVRHRDGHLIWVNDYGRKVTTPDGTDYLYCLIQNIDEQEQLNHKLALERKQYQDALNNNSLFHYNIDLTKGIFTDEISKLPGAEMLGDYNDVFPIAYDEELRILREGGIIPMDDMSELAYHREAILDLFEHGETQLEFHFHVEGTDTYLRVLALFHRNEDDGHVHGNFIFYDESEIKKAEIERENETKQAYHIIDALSKEYPNVYALTPEEDKSIVIKYSEDEIVESLLDEIKYAEQNKLNYIPYTKATLRFVNQVASEEEVDEVLKALSLENVVNELQDKDEYSYNFRYYHAEKAGMRQVRYIRLPDGKIVYAARNIDEILEKEAKQRRIIEEALKEAEYASKAKTAFLNNMSHDIRTPMNAIIGFTNLATKHIKESDKIEEYLSKIQNSSNHLLNLINEVLDMSRIESGKIEIEEDVNSLTKVCDDVVDILNVSMDLKSLHFNYKDTDIKDDLVWCDKLQLSRILLNCMSNAIKFTPDRGTIGLSISQKESNESGYACYVIKISDTGIGMDAEYVEHIFEPFSREHSSTVSGIQGTGLGMSITKSLVDLMHGNISVTSKKHKGTTFTIEVKFRLVGENSSTELMSENGNMSENRADRTDFEGLRILLVEDNEMNREIAQEILEEFGARVDTAEDGAIAVEMVKFASSARYDVIIMDIQMPVMDGYDATKVIRSFDDSVKSKIPIIAMTANAFEEDKKLAFDAGMNGYIAKPVNPRVLLETINQLL